MVFNSLEFILFFLFVVLLYFLIPHKFRWALLLSASSFFYMTFVPSYILILAVLIIIDYFAGILIENSEGKKRKYYLIASILSTCFSLFIFKYFNFFAGNLNNFAQFLHWNYSVKYLQIILPVGLSFHTFQSLSYVIEVYKKNQKAERHFGIYALYVMFFPQLVAGPIERPQNLLWQFYQKHNFDSQRVADGLKLMALGFFKKTVVADRLALFVNEVYNNLQNYHGISLGIATVFFAFQIYYDFSGYSDIAIGSAKIMGFDLKQNFNRPYFSRSISEFWQKWHISLSSWFRDYIYIPLGGSHEKFYKWCFNIFLTFLLSGLWHGANWTFIIWGALHGFYYIFGKITLKIRLKLSSAIGLVKIPFLYKYIQILTTFFLVCFGWIFFRAQNLNSAFYVIKNLFIPSPGIFSSFIKAYALEKISTPILGQPAYEFFIAIISILFMGIIYMAQKETNDKFFLSGKPILLKWAFYYCIIFGIIFFGIISETKFIYFQF